MAGGKCAYVVQLKTPPAHTEPWYPVDLETELDRGNRAEGVIESLRFIVCLSWAFCDILPFSTPLSEQQATATRT